MLNCFGVHHLAAFIIFLFSVIANFYPVFGGVRTHDLSVTSVNQEQLDLRRFKFDVQITFLFLSCYSFSVDVYGAF